MNITELSTTELKALAYEQLKQLNNIQNNLAVIEGELQTRVGESVVDLAKERPIKGQDLGITAAIKQEENK